MPVHPKVPPTVSPTVSPKVSTKVSCAPSSTQVTTSTKKQTTGTKRKQISLDELPVKRACNTQETVDSEIKCPSTSKGISSVTPNTGPTSEKFRFAWLSRFPWLAYSAVANSGFSVTCVLFWL